MVDLNPVLQQIQHLMPAMKEEPAAESQLPASNVSKWRGFTFEDNYGLFYVQRSLVTFFSFACILSVDYAYEDI
jgi:hypothetical protein